MSLNVFLTVSVFILIVAVAWVILDQQTGAKKTEKRPSELQSLSFYIPFVPGSLTYSIQPRLGLSKLNRDELGLIQPWLDDLYATTIELGATVPKIQVQELDLLPPLFTSKQDHEHASLFTDLGDIHIDPSDFREAIPVPALTLQIKSEETSDEAFELMLGGLMEQIEDDFKSNSVDPIAIFTRIHERTLKQQRIDASVEYYACFDRLLGEDQLSGSQLEAVNQYRELFLTGVKPRQVYLTEMLDSTTLPS